MAFPPDLQRLLGRRLSRRLWSRRSHGSALVQALMAALIALIGALVLASRLFSSRFNSFSRSDTQAAREAAEFGLNELQAQLNTNQQGYLWVTRQDRWSTVTINALNTCNIPVLDSSGNQLTSLPALPAGIASSRTIRNVNGATISYRLRTTNGFQPPQFPDQDPTTLNQPASCNAGTTSAANAAAAANFGNLNGGSAIITVVGSVQRGSANATTFAMSRRVHVLSPARELKFSFIILGNAYSATCKDKNGKGSLPGCTPDASPISPSVFGDFSDITRLNVLDGNICYGTPTGCSSPLELAVIGCADLDSCIVNNVDTVSGKNRKGFCTQKIKGKKKKSIICNDFQQAAPIAMPASFQLPAGWSWSTLAKDMTCDAGSSKDDSKCAGNAPGSKEEKSYFPYYNQKKAPTSLGDMTNADLVQGCYFSNTNGSLTGTSAGSVAINCLLRGKTIQKDGKVTNFISGNTNLVVETSLLPVNLFLYDKPSDGLAYDLEQAGIENSNPSNWFRLRILGEPPVAVAEGDPIGCGKTRIISTKDNDINGAFVWLPNGWLEYAKTDTKDSSFNVIWVCKFTAPTKKDKGYQMITPKTFDDTVRATLQLNLPGFSSATGGVYRAYGSEDTPAP